MVVLQQYLDRQAALIELLGDKYCDDEFAFAGIFGTPMHTSNFRLRYFLPIKKAANIVKPFTFHDLRHTHATILLQAGVNIKVIQERLGHESVTLTLDTYSHLFPGMQDTAVTTLDCLKIYGKDTEGASMIKRFHFKKVSSFVKF